MYLWKGMRTFEELCMINIIMRRFLLMNKSRVLLDESFGYESIGLKLCINRQILKHPDAFQWNEACQRWEATAQVRFEYCLEYPLELQLFLLRDHHPLVICQGIVAPSILARHLNEEVKVLLSYDGLVTGWLYCHFSVEGQQEEASQENEKFLSMQKINLAFLEEIEEEINIQIKQNNQLIFEKTFRLNQRSKTLFPNLKKPVRLSDVFKIQVSLANISIKPIMFLVDHIKRGKNTTFQAWLRNKHKNKIGNIFIQYYMENLFLENQRQLRTRKAIHPDSLEYAKTIAAKKINDREAECGQNERTRKNTVLIKRRIEEADKRILLINNSVNLMLLEIKNNEGSSPCLRKTKATFNYENSEINKEKLTFYFEGQNQKQ